MTQKSTCDNLLKWGAFLLIGFLIFRFFEQKNNESKTANEVAKENFANELSDLRKRYVNKVTKDGVVIVPDGPKYSTKSRVVVEDGEVAKVTKTKRSVVPLQRGKKYGLVGSRQSVSEGMSEYEQRAEALLPKDSQELSEVEKKWISKAHLPSVQQIKDAQFVQQDVFFHQIPVKNRRDGASVARPALKKPTPPNLLFDQPIVD